MAEDESVKKGINEFLGAQIDFIFERSYAHVHLKGFRPGLWDEEVIEEGK